MRRYIRAALAAALLAPLLSAVHARAQDDAAAPAEHSEGRPRDGGMADRLKNRLGLTDEQSSKFRDALKAHGEAMKQLGLAVKESVKKLADDLKAKAADEELLAALASLKTARKAVAEENAKFEESLASILTPTQRAKAAVGMAKIKGRRFEGRRGKKDDDDGDADGGRRGDADHDDGEGRQ